MLSLYKVRLSTMMWPQTSFSSKASNISQFGFLTSECAIAQSPCVLLCVGRLVAVDWSVPKDKFQKKGATASRTADTSTGEVELSAKHSTTTLNEAV